MDCGKMQLDDLISCLNVFFILNWGFLLHYSDVITTDLEAEEVPGVHFNHQSPQACPGEFFLVQTATAKATLSKIACGSHTSLELSFHTPSELSSYTCSTQSILGTSKTAISEKHKKLSSFPELSLPILLALHMYLSTYILCWTGPRSGGIVPGTESTLPGGPLRALQDLPGVSLAGSKHLIWSRQ